MTLEERLNEQISEKDEKIEELEGRLEAIERTFDRDMLLWQMHRPFENDAFSQQMPYPRLEMRLRRTSEDNWYSIEWLYGLVYKHFADTANDMLRFVPFSLTNANGGKGTFESWFKDGKLDLPFRDGVHIRAEASLFGLPAYIVCREINICQKIELEEDRIIGQVRKMRS